MANGDVKKALKCISKIKTFKFVYEWTITNFSVNAKKNQEFISSEPFSSSNNPNLKWHLHIYPKGCNEKFQENVSLFLNITSTNSKISPVNVEARIECCCLNSKKEEKYNKTIMHHYQESEGYGFQDFIRRDCLFNEINDLLPNDELTIVCKVTAGIDSQNIKNEVKNLSEEESNEQLTLSNMHKEVGLFLLKKELTDVTLVGKGIEFPAHRVVLAARSSVFLEMLKNDMKHYRRSRIDFTDINSEVLSEMLRFLYTGKVTNIDKYSKDLLGIANKYLLTGLKTVCENFYYNKLCISNAANTLTLACHYNCDNLKARVANYIIAHGKVIIESPQFENLKKLKPDIMAELFSALVLKDCL